MLYRKRGVSLRVPARAPGPVADTARAGDACNGGLATALSEGCPIKEALRFGIAVAGISVTRQGAAVAMLALAAMHAFLDS